MKLFSFKFRVPWGGEKHGEIRAKDAKTAARKIREQYYYHRLINLVVKEIVR